MNFFIDFDNTLYNTELLTKEMLTTLAKYIEKNCEKDYNKALEKISEKFGRGENKIFDIYELITYFSKEYYNYNIENAVNSINEVISNGKKYLYDDAIDFLQYLKEKNHKTYILSYNENKVYYQSIKIAGSSILEYVNGLITTTTIKGDMPLDFKNGIFIDDKPRDLISIYEKNPLKIYRIRRSDNKYSKLETNIPIQEFLNLRELKEELQIKEKI